MGHQVDSCDFLDVLEESAVTKKAVRVELRDGRHFVDAVKDVVTEDGRNVADFRQHGRIAIGDIANCSRTEPLEHTYDAKL